MSEQKSTDRAEAASPAKEFLSRLAEPFAAIDHPGADDRTPQSRVLATLCFLLALALLVRLPYYHGRLFPLNDGGMFAEVLDNLRAAHFALPTQTTYNFLHIPLSYPPLGFYLGALCTLLPGQTAVTVLTWLPLVINLANVLLIYFVAREIYPSHFYASVAACCYAVMGRSAEWLTMGGGLTRAPGAACAAVAILFFLRATRRNSWRLAAFSGLWAGLAALFHLEGGVFAALSLVMLSLLEPGRVANLRRLVLAGAVAVLTVLPWLWWVYLHVGLEPLRNAAHSGGSYQYTSPSMFVLLVAAMAIAVVTRYPYLVWLAIIPFVMRRSPTHYGPMVGGICMVWFANALVVLVVRSRRWLQAQYRQQSLVAIVALGMALLLGGMPSASSDRLTDLRDNARAQLSPAELDAMQAARRLTPPEARFFVFNQRFGAWPVDMVSEWFPYFARRHAVNTVQGQEWLPGRAFERAARAEADLEMAGSPRVAAERMQKAGADYLYLAGPLDENQQWLAQALLSATDGAPIYRNAEVAIYRLKHAN
jgi:hypothetical protein